jgi:hypothetical protein
MKMPRQGETVDKTNHNGAAASILPLRLINNLNSAKELMEGASFDWPRHRERGELRNKIPNSKANLQCTSCASLRLIAYRRGVWL